ncbi:GyrI-like domain-containing protein [Elioraea sp.]|uniref:AraC family transcriptional regulator n=1 Tax=Elioraea sp. TaxID=2185103 RepID=UPI0025C4BCB9|nr:AraC family transcriptional regulator [Elioraea sp.]
MPPDTVTTATTATRHAERLSRALAHLGDNLDAPPGLEALASVAAFSPFHFHRIWTAAMGETIADTTRRLLLHRAAHELVRGALPLARIAQRAGYAGLPAFGRAFKAAYGISPAAYRRAGGIGVPPVHVTPNEDGTMHDVSIIRFPGAHCAALRHIGAYQDMGPVFDRLAAWAGARGLIGEATRFIGVYHDEPDAVPLSKLRSDAALTIPAGTAVERPITLLDIPATRAAMFTFKGPYAELEGAYRWLYGTWLPASGEEPADFPCFEDYLNDPKTLPPPEWLTAVYLPLRG